MKTWSRMPPKFLLKVPFVVNEDTICNMVREKLVGKKNGSNQSSPCEAQIPRKDNMEAWDNWREKERDTNGDHGELERNDNENHFLRKNKWKKIKCHCGVAALFLAFSSLFVPISKPQLIPTFQLPPLLPQYPYFSLYLLRIFSSRQRSLSLSNRIHARLIIIVSSILTLIFIYPYMFILYNQVSSPSFSGSLD